MGTSAAYSAPPSWGDLKTAVTKTAGGGTLLPETARELVHSFIEHNGGVNAIARGAGRRGGSVARGRSARGVAARLGGFLSDARSVGLDQALRNAGWSDLIGQPIGHVLSALLDRLGGPSSTIDDVDARMALAKLRDKYFAEARTPEELEQLIARHAADLEAILLEYFGIYLYEVFCRVFFERLVQRVGENRAHSYLDQIGAFIASALENRTVGRAITGIDWAGPEGQQLTADVMETTLSVFGG
jgi:hypothetical protein